MDTGEVAVGMRARYGRTGTVGTVTAVQAIDGENFAELDSTGLLYRVDQLAPAGAARAGRREKTVEEIEEQLRREREGITRTDGSQFELDNSCEGGG
jgi:hypothetical protein